MEIRLQADAEYSYDLAKSSAIEAMPARSELRVALVSMPFASVARPSIQLGVLSSLLKKHGYRVSALHLYLDFAKYLGPSVYEAFCQHRGRMLGDWLFSAAAFGVDSPDPHGNFIDAFPNEINDFLKSADISKTRLLEIRNKEVPRYLDLMTLIEDWRIFDVIGYTSTFQQNTASIALATRLKAINPQVVNIFGGANFEAEMGEEFIKKIDSIDYIVDGEAEESLPQLLSAIQSGRTHHQIAGVRSRTEREEGVFVARPPTQNLDEVPAPEYEEYFVRAESLGLLPKAGRRAVELPFESSRGCWWGQKHHCTFCGLNGLSISYRAKDKERVINELTEMSRKYRSNRFTAVDNILSISHIDGVFSELVSREFDFEFFYEVKANLTREQIGKLYKGGVRTVQPGIESLSSRVLRNMKKGITASQNVNFLRWSLYYGLSTAWNMLWGFPNEKEEDYESQEVLVSNLIHLPPPTGFGRVWMERFSPLYYDNNSFPVHYVSPEASYSFVYPDYIDLGKIAYFFEYKFECTLPDHSYARLVSKLTAWQNAWKGGKRPSLRYWYTPNQIHIEDHRYPEREGTYTFEGVLAELYRGCAQVPLPAKSLHQRLSLPWQIEEVEAALNEFVVRGLMMCDEGKYLSLAVPALGAR